MSANDLVNLVEKLNYDLYGRSSNLVDKTGICFVFNSIGYSDCIEVLGVTLWDSENDERKIVEDRWYEDLETYIRREFNKLIYNLQEVRL